MLLDREMQLAILTELSETYPSSVNISEKYDYGSEPHLASITHIGMDFLADDGGLSAILGVVTIKFEAEQFRTILESMILSSNLPTERKQTMIDALRELPAESIKHLTTRIVDAGWDNLDSLMTIIQNSLL